MKTLTLITALLLSLTAIGQTWERVPVVDEFEEATGDTVTSILIKEGKFSNSATLASHLCVKIVDYGNGNDAMIYLFEYCRSKATFGKTAYGVIRFRTNDHTYESKALYSKGSSAILIESGSKFYNWMSSGKHDAKVLVNEKDFGGYGTSKYIFECVSKNK